MNREDYLEGLREQYAEEIQEAYVECSHERGKVTDVPTLKSRLLKLQKNAKVEGLVETEFADLVNTALSDEVRDRLNWGGGKKAA
jgi:hypothetical protein